MNRLVIATLLLLLLQPACAGESEDGPGQSAAGPTKEMTLDMTAAALRYLTLSSRSLSAGGPAATPRPSWRTSAAVLPPLALPAEQASPCDTAPETDASCEEGCTEDFGACTSGAEGTIARSYGPDGFDVSVAFEGYAEDRPSVPQRIALDGEATVTGPIPAGGTTTLAVSGRGTLAATVDGLLSSAEASATVTIVVDGSEVAVDGTINLVLSNQAGPATMTFAALTFDEACPGGPISGWIDFVVDGQKALLQAHGCDSASLGFEGDDFAAELSADSHARAFAPSEGLAAQLRSEALATGLAGRYWEQRNHNENIRVYIALEPILGRTGYFYEWSEVEGFPWDGYPNDNDFDNYTEGSFELRDGMILFTPTYSARYDYESSSSGYVTDADPSSLEMSELAFELVDAFEMQLETLSYDLTTDWPGS